MSINTPPDPNVSTFNNLYWIAKDEAVTIEYADKNYLKFPVAQGSETLQNFTVSGTATFNSTQLPTAPLAILPASTDSSNKIPTTQWVQLARTCYSQLYSTAQTITTPANCYAIDVVCVGAGGAAGANVSGYWGGSGSGGNTISGYGIPMANNESLVLTLSSTSGTGSTTITRNAVILCRAFNGNSGTIGTIGANAAGGASNSTVGIGDTSFSSWYNAFGNAGAASTNNGLTAPVMTAPMTGTPKGRTTWANGTLGCAQRIPAELQGGGYVIITFHIGN
jgi:hypothetical protein